MTNNLYNLDVFYEFFNDIDTSNTVDGKPVYYWTNKQDMTVPLDAGYVGLVNCTRITVQDLSLTKNGQGILLAFTSNTTITRNNITNNLNGIHGYNSAPTPASLGNIIFENMIANNYGGVAFGWYSYNNIFSENNITNNTRPCAAGIAGGYSATILGNNIKNNYIGIDAGSSSLISGNNVTENSYIGVTLGYTTYGITVSGNNITKNGPRTYSLFWYPIAAGIDLLGSSYNIISGNNIADNFGKGIWLHHQSQNNVISGNTITNNSYRQMVADPRSGGIGVGWGWGGGDPCPNNIISGNNITNHRYYGTGLGILLASSSNNTVVENNITNNDAGVVVGGTLSSNNKIYHNTFMNNTSQAVASGSTDVWDDSYPSGGNYWSDYTGVDLRRGPNQNQYGSDGIGDTPYVIDTNNRDRYPLMKPYPWDPHDIAIKNMTTSKTAVGHGYTIHINITIFNYGSYTENFNVTAYANSTIISTFKNINLASRTSTTITFVWNTTGVARGNYTMKAVADTVPNETDCEDNTFVDGAVRVVKPGDFGTIAGGYYDFDNKCDYQDLFLFRKAYSEQYHPLCDFDEDQDVDYLDLFQFRKCYISDP